MLCLILGILHQGEEHEVELEKGIERTFFQSQKNYSTRNWESYSVVFLISEQLSIIFIQIGEKNLITRQSIRT